MVAPNYISQVSAPASLGNPDSVTTAFDGDLSYQVFTFEKRTQGSATFEQPTSGYVQRPENAAIFGYSYNSAGHNQSLSSNDGRTGSSTVDLRFTHAGQGDFGAIHISGIVTGAKSGAANFLANPAAVMINGQLMAASTGAYLNVLELNSEDLGFQAAAIGAVFNFKRTIGTSTLGEVWFGIRPQSSDLPSDVAYSVGGNWKRVVDTTDASLTTGNAAIVLKTGHRVYFEGQPSGVVGWSQNAGGASLFSDGSQLVFGYGNIARLLINSSLVTVNTTNGLCISGTGKLRLANDGYQFSTGTAVATFSASNKPGTYSGPPTQWINVVLGNGYEFVIPAWPKG